MRAADTYREKTSRISVAFFSARSISYEVPSREKLAVSSAERCLVITLHSRTAPSSWAWEVRSFIGQKGQGVSAARSSGGRFSATNVLT